MTEILLTCLLAQIVIPILMIPPLLCGLMVKWLFE